MINKKLLERICVFEITDKQYKTTYDIFLKLVENIKVLDTTNVSPLVSLTSKYEFTGISNSNLTENEINPDFFQNSKHFEKETNTFVCPIAVE